MENFRPARFAAASPSELTLRCAELAAQRLKGRQLHTTVYGPRLACWCVAAAIAGCGATARAQNTLAPTPQPAPSAPAAPPTAASDQPASTTPPPPSTPPRAASDQPASSEAGAASPAKPDTIGGLPEAPSGEQYTSPLETLGISIGVDSYALSLLSGLIYLVAVYPLQALFGSNKVEPVMLWMLVPIAGPWFAQYEDHVRHKPGWRGLLIADSALQATGLVLGLIGAALSGTRAADSEDTGLSLRFGLASGGFGLTLNLRTL